MGKTSARRSMHKRSMRTAAAAAAATAAAALGASAVVLFSACTTTAIPTAAGVVVAAQIKQAFVVRPSGTASSHRFARGDSSARGNCHHRTHHLTGKKQKLFGIQHVLHTMPSVGAFNTASLVARLPCGRGLPGRKAFSLRAVEVGAAAATAGEGGGEGSDGVGFSTDGILSPSEVVATASTPPAAQDSASKIAGERGSMDSTMIPMADSGLVNDIFDIVGDAVVSTSVPTAALTQAGAEHEKELVTAADNNNNNNPSAIAAAASATEESIVVDTMTTAGTSMECISVPAGLLPKSASTSVESEAWSTAGDGGRGRVGGGDGGGVDSIIEVISLPGSTYENDDCGDGDGAEGGIARRRGRGRGIGRAPHEVFTQARGPAATVTAIVKREPVYGEKNSRAMIMELVGFTLPLLIVWLSNPIMSLVDTAVVGAKSSLELAALGPGTSVCDNVAYVCGFLAQVTTNLGASALVSEDKYKANRATLTGMLVSLVVGLGVTHSLLRHGSSMVRLVIGDNAAVSSVLPYSCAYVYIRAMGFVAVTVSMVLQGAYLAKKDIATPIKSVAGSSLVNLVLDCVMVFGMGMGIKGAALSTTVAQWTGLLYLLKQVVPDLRNSGAVSCLPKWAEVKNFLLLGAPTAVALTGQVATCMALTFAASGCDTIALAAHQVIYGVFVLFCPIGEAVSQTVQTYLPGFTVPRPPRANGTRRKTTTFGKSAVRMMKVVSGVALALGGINATLATLLTGGMPFLFTPDPEVWAAMRLVSPLCGLNLVLYGLIATLQGTMMATRDVYPMAGIYATCSTLFCTLFFMMRRQSARAATGLKLTSVWQLFLIYQLARCSLFAATVVWTHRDSLRGNLLSQDGPMTSPSEAAAKVSEAEAMLVLASPAPENDAGAGMDDRHVLFAREA